MDCPTQAFPVRKSFLSLPARPKIVEEEPQASSETRRRRPSATTTSKAATKIPPRSTPVHGRIRSFRTGGFGFFLSSTAIAGCLKTPTGGLLGDFPSSMVSVNNGGRSRSFDMTGGERIMEQQR
mmetsp:Transcript_11600/g.34149  ORF Transcript_11600/g.34149 Transcript_11600/m.34149 type:complete len:124 (-) Transcript_11600:48-419(-)|eukprot:CAMPEP_0113526574 /NCGR_PEP_ID=MMETSP0015_2-20120614/820_1 /TAXON_ID=2838 /ORGANISM="Odontella" /LENGTH=123 /DNA_ID=CAMNT_0000424921 /DNA_START=541 /DNA_END=912 /DNA_ORIENTATION=+ /assembly_acc=CAM_ASM_000160